VGLDLDRMKEFVTKLPEGVLADIDDIARRMSKTRSLFIEEACCFYIEKIKRDNMLESMKTGYLEMAEINQVLAEEIWCDFACFPRNDYDDEYYDEEVGRIVRTENLDKWRKT